MRKYLDNDALICFEHAYYRSKMRIIHIFDESFGK